MQIGENATNRIAGEKSFPARPPESNGGKVHGFITYKRRKYSGPCTKRNLPEDDGDSIAEDRSSDQTTKETHDGLQYRANEEHGYASHSRDRPGLMKCGNDVPFGHWKDVMEHILQSLDVSEIGIRRCIQDAVASAQGKDTIHCCKDGQECSYRLELGSKSFSGIGVAGKEHEWIISDGSLNVKESQTDGRSFSECCESVFRDVIISGKFVSFCNLLCEHFKGIKADSILNFSLINSRMCSGQYEHAPELFASDFQQEWTKFEKIGEQMIHLAKSISDLAHYSFQRQEIVQVDAEQNDSLDLNTSNQLLSYHSDPNTRPERTEARGLYKISTCRECGAEAEGEGILICDSCEAIYHVSCIEPAIEDLPIDWNCAACSMEGKELLETESTEIQGEISLGELVVQERCKITSIPINENDKEMVGMFDDIDETPDCSMKPDGLQVAWGSTSSHLCKLCNEGEEESKKMLECGNEYCLNRYYHQRCLSSKQLTRPCSCWYCPSCLCRACLNDKDDDKIVLCDGCDEAYHIYCMVPPRTSIPKGNWYCLYCSVVVRRRRKIIKKQERHNPMRESGASGSVDMLLSVAEKLDFEENTAARES